MLILLLIALCAAIAGGIIILRGSQKHQRSTAVARPNGLAPLEGSYRLAAVLTPVERLWLPKVEAALAELGEGYRLCLQTGLRKFLASETGTTGGERLLRHRLDFAIIGPDHKLVAAIEVLDPLDQQGLTRWNRIRPLLNDLGVACIELDQSGDAALLFQRLFGEAEAAVDHAMQAPATGDRLRTAG